VDALPREATAVDVARIETLKLEDFAADFSHIKPADPSRSAVEEAEISAMADAFVSTLEGTRER